MLKNYLTIALRNLRKQKAYSFINVAGLAIGLACCLLIVRYIQDEQSYDRFHENADRIYRVVAGFEDGPPTNANNGFSWGPTIEKDFPEVEYMARLHKMGWGEERVVARGDQRFYEDSFFFADPDIFQIFSFPFVAGDPATALVEPNTVVITESMAQKYLPGEDALGKMISADPYNDGQFIDFTITGVMEDIPENSHVHFDFLASVATEGELAGWGFDPVFTYMLLAEGADPSDMEARFPDMLASHIPADRLAQFPLTLHLQPLTDIRLHSNLRAELEPTGDIAYVYLFSAIGLLILVIACINFMNLATARSAQRAREVGMRKVLGAARPQLIRQFLGEALLLSGLALVLAMALIQVALPVFNSLSGKAISINYLDNLALLGSLVGLTLLVGVVAGSYPAFFLSAFRPSEVLKGQTRHGRSRAVALRKGLVVFQFAISIFLIASTAVVYQQMQYIRAKNLGFDREQIVVLPLNDEVRASYETMRNTLLQDTGIQAIALSEQVPARAGSGSRYTIEGIDEPVSAYRLFTDHTFLNTYGMNLVAGRGFSEAVPTDSTD
ncbi:MAG TPA: ABC transporter permease, partial [Rhodothermales bacterium]|nr:ABC transporter permease [Rhodothermales bacterium]